MVWSHSITEAGELLNSAEEKFSLGEMIFGAVSKRGLIPKNHPIFVSGFLSGYEPVL